MNYLALARKWRPRTFSQLIGQEHITKILANALTQQKIHHAYLFTGTRGVGKTSVARILAKCLNCETAITPEPCLQCDTCLAIEQGRFIDLIEIDGASKTRVEDTRELLDNIQYLPANGRFKIYLIDEVHMLSQHSFNALLKTLEEPPAHVKFILATTDPQKLPVTVLSRCLQFNLKHLSIEHIQQQLQLILQAEQQNYEDNALLIIAKAARGSMRDALSLLDQAMSSCNQILSAQEVKQLLGYTQQDYAIQILNALANQDALQLITISQQISIEGGYFSYVLDELLHYLHHAAIYQILGGDNPLILPEPALQGLASCFSAEDMQLFYQIGLKGQHELSLAPTQAIGFNMTLLRMLTFRPAPRIDLASIKNANQSLPPPAQTMHVMQTETSSASQPTMTQNHAIIQKLAVTSPQPAVTMCGTEENTAAYENSSTTLTMPLAYSKEDMPSSPLPGYLLAETIPDDSDIEIDWSKITPQLQLTGLALNAIENTELVKKTTKELFLRISKKHSSLFTPTVIQRIEAAVSSYYQKPMKVTLNYEEQTIATPAQQKKEQTQQKQQNAEIALNNDKVFQQLKKEFAAELVKNSIIASEEH